MSITPFIKTPQAQGGTFYTFSSAAKDLTKGFSNDNLKLVFSKFVCLNIPDFQPVYPTGNEHDTHVEYINHVQLNSILGAEALTPEDTQHMHRTDMNMAFAEHMQNYILNLEELILSDESYDNTTNKTVSERVFFKWLIETGAIRFRNAIYGDPIKSEKSSEELVSFVEDDSVLEEYDAYNTSNNGEDMLNRYNRVVKYIGDIDIVNNVDMAGEAYSELYINIPTEVGNTPTILFKSVSDNNYGPKTHEDGCIENTNSEYIVGRDEDSEHPQSLSIRAFYDEPRKNKYILGYRSTTAPFGLDIQQGTPDKEPENPHANQYKNGDIETEDAEGKLFRTSYSDSVEDISLPYINENYEIKFLGGGDAGGETYKITRSKLDGIEIDFDESHYYKIMNNPAISTFAEFNGKNEAESFEFNAVLVYYDMIDSATNTSSARNLYGILILDNVVNNSCSSATNMPDAYIQRYPKFMPNKVTGQNGNSYGFKINLRFDVSPGTAGVNTVINEYNTFSMQIFSEAMAQLQNSTKVLLQQRDLIEKMYERILRLESAYHNINSLSIIDERMKKLEDEFDANSATLQNTSSLLQLINKNYDEIANIKRRITIIEKYIASSKKSSTSNTISNTVQINGVSSTADNLYK